MSLDRDHPKLSPLRRLPILLVPALIFLAGAFYFYSQQTPPTTTIVYRIALDETWYPLQLFDKEDDITAFSKELTLKIAENQNFKVELLPVESGSLFTNLEGRYYAGVLSSLLVLEGDIENYVFTKPYYLLGPVLVVSTSSSIRSLNDLQGKTIGVIQGSRPTLALIKEGSIKLKYYDYNYVSTLVDDVANHVIDGMILGMIPAYEYTKSGMYPGKLRIASEPLTDDGLRLIAKRDQLAETLINLFDAGLDEIKRTGVYNQELLKWDLFNPKTL